MNNTINDLISVATLNTVSMDNAISTSTTYLPSEKEYSEMANKIAFQFTAQWSEPKYQCPKCGGGMCKNLMVVLTSYPVQCEYQCDKCGHIDYQYM
jgi:hypothetical protein